MGSRPAL